MSDKKNLDVWRKLVIQTGLSNVETDAIINNLLTNTP